MRNEDVLHRVKEERNILHIIQRWKSTRNLVGHTFRRNCLLKHIITGKIKGGTEVTGRQGRRRKQLMDNFKKKRAYWELKEEELDSSVWKRRFGRPNLSQNRLRNE